MAWSVLGVRMEESEGSCEYIEKTVAESR
jgi:hypothetical protein